MGQPHIAANAQPWPHQTQGTVVALEWAVEAEVVAETGIEVDAGALFRAVAIEVERVVVAHHPRPQPRDCQLAEAPGIPGAAAWDRLVLGRSSAPAVEAVGSLQVDTADFENRLQRLGSEMVKARLQVVCIAEPAGFAEPHTAQRHY